MSIITSPYYSVPGPTPLIAALRCISLQIFRMNIWTRLVTSYNSRVGANQVGYITGKVLYEWVYEMSKII